tara:strand:+ start:297 stop:446 length:150 start_codon:yes stop_codon:yes gene_type:complete
MLSSFMLLLVVAIVVMIASLLFLLQKVLEVERRIETGEIVHWTKRKYDE